MMNQESALTGDVFSCVSCSDLLTTLRFFVRLRTNRRSLDKKKTKKKTGSQVLKEVMTSMVRASLNMSFKSFNLKSHVIH